MRHHSHWPHEIEKGATTRSPRLTRVTAGPTSSTMPMNSWPSTTPLGSPGTRPWYWCRSEPQTALVVMRTTTSVGSTIFGSATDSTRTSPVPCSVIAFIEGLLPCSEVPEMDQAYPLPGDDGARGGIGEPGHLGLALL